MTIAGHKAALTRLMGRAADEIEQVENGQGDNNLEESQETLNEAFQLARRKTQHIYQLYDAAIEEVEDKIAVDESYRTEGDTVVKSLNTRLAALQTEWLEFQTRYRRAAVAWTA